MTQIGVSNLRYRISAVSGNDEFAVIAGKINEMCDVLQTHIEREYLLEIRQKTAEFNALQASINPHFMNNTLEAVRNRLVESGNQDAADMVVMLSRLFNYQTRGGKFVTVREEIEKLNLYIDIYNLRYRGAFDVSINVDADIYPYGMPKYVLQPILENYFMHGIDMGRNNDVRIIGRLDGENIHIEIRDNGRGIESGRLKELREQLAEKSFQEEAGMGLKNVDERIRLIYGDGYGLQVDSEGTGTGTSVVLLMKARTISDLESGQRDI